MTTPVQPQKSNTSRPLRYFDYGFFGPGSPSWKVWSAPTALIGFQRSVVLEHFDPFLTAAVADLRGIYKDPHGRLDRTLVYFLTVAVADSCTAIEVSERLMRLHAKATGIEPISGKSYSANDPESQLWIHLTGWHSVLKCYEMYGPGRLTPAEEERYWAECALAAELQTCSPADVPRSREGIRAYFANVRPRLCVSERAREGMHYLLRTPRAQAGLNFWIGSRLMAPATIASLPHWMRVLGGFDQSAIVDRTVLPIARAAMVAGRHPKVMLAVLKRQAPRTGEVMRQHLQAPPPLCTKTLTPSQARERYGSKPEKTEVPRPQMSSVSAS